MPSGFWLRTTIISCMLSLVLTACAATWTYAEILSQEEVVEPHYITKETRNCGIEEPHNVTCTAGTQSSFNASVGIGFDAGITISPAVSTSLGFTDTSGDVLQLPIPPPGQIYIFKIVQEFHKIQGQVKAVSSTGQERVGPYTFQASCDQHITETKLISCSSQGAEDQPTPLPEPIVPTSPPAQSGGSFHTISFGGTGSWDSNLGLSAGSHTLNGVPFNTGTYITTMGCPDGEGTDYTIPVNLDNVTSVYLLIQGGNAFAKYAGVQVGMLSLIYPKTQIDYSLILGNDIRDWSLDDVAVNTLSSPLTTEAWLGVDPKTGRQGRMDMITINGADTDGTPLEAIKMRDTSAYSNLSPDPCIHLQAITVKTR